ncbi:MAG: transcriptional regulator [Methanoregula sp.]|nr:transcriptional regulator [Methanoregula sp.]
MSKTDRHRTLALFILIVLCLLPTAWAAGTLDYTTTYTITLIDEGTAHWTVEYRTPLATDSDILTFENYTRDLDSVYLPEIENLMKSSATQAADATSRTMTVENFSGNAVIQTTPTGKVGVVTLTFYWTHFAVPDDGLTAGDAFVGGLYLLKGNTLIIRYPDGYTVSTAEPAPDQQAGNALVWYGTRSFGTGEPVVVLKKTAFPVIPVAAGCSVALIIVAGLVLYQRKKHESLPSVPVDPKEDPDDPTPPLSESDKVCIEDRILRQLRANGGEQYQSDLAKTLDIPKSTLSSTLNDLHQRQIIVKVKKGRENLIRLTDDHR